MGIDIVSEKEKKTTVKGADLTVLGAKTLDTIDSVVSTVSNSIIIVIIAMIVAVAVLIGGIGSFVKKNCSSLQNGL